MTLHTDSPDISVITVGMNHLRFIKELFGSLFENHNGQTSFEVIYVDNCSTDGSVEFIQSRYPNVKIISNTHPMGFAANNNLGVSKAKGKYVAILNPDITVSQDTLNRLFSFSEALPYDAIVAPRLLNTDGTHQYSTRNYMNFKSFIVRLFTRSNDKATDAVTSEYLCKGMDTTKVQFVNWAIGAALFMKKSCYETLQGFDTKYFMYVEDVDLCLRAWKRNIPVVYYPKVQLTHDAQRASSKIWKKTAQHIKSILIFFCKHGINVGDQTPRAKGLTLPAE